VCTALRRRGVILRPLGDTLVLMPPLSILEAEVDLLVDAVRDAILEVAGA
jgi:adenosylmethionine-8-amino-7-oxononanoate aminotransferase